jgi:hypothetical protein
MVLSSSFGVDYRLPASGFPRSYETRFFDDLQVITVLCLQMKVDRYTARFQIEFVCLQAHEVATPFEAARRLVAHVNQELTELLKREFKVDSVLELEFEKYYRKGKQINLVLARDQLAHELGLAAGFHLDSSGRLEIRFDPEVNVIPGEHIQLRLVHATRPGLDQDLVFDNHQLHRLEAELQLPGPGRWNLYLQTEDWRLTGSLQYPQKQQARLLPNYVVPDIASNVK